MARNLHINSLDLAAQFAVPHREVLHRVDELLGDGMESSGVRETHYLDAAGSECRCVDMTRHSAMLVVPCLNSAKANAFTFKLIEARDAHEAVLAMLDGPGGSDRRDPMREAFDACVAMTRERRGY